ncbi:hypothetical protein F8M41_026000 [Gigaspora margarita]|uniref:Uncharacterized protein n=1 Tax=Gigaspora margarita TaxID=4874 RepID=A0A8H4A9D6_GIGMA|nr:hypothetical protein F8M41_026000 [Gigaspora margarita]
MKTKLYNLRFIVITTCIFLLTFLPNGFTQDAINNSTFSYQEASIQANLTGMQPQILQIDHYNDNSGIAIVRIARLNYIDDFNNACYEQRLLLRVIQANGSVIKINYENTTEIQDINYCDNYNSGKTPLGIYPLFDQYILVTYTHATNTSNTTTYTDRGMVFDWGGNILSNENGTFSLLQNGTIPLAQNAIDYLATACATLDNGYALIYTNRTLKTSAANFSYTGIYAIMLYYNSSITSQSLVLYQSINQDITFSNLYCFIDFVNIGYSCIAYADTTAASSTTSTLDSFYMRIRFLSSGTVMSLDIFSPSNNEYFLDIEPLPLGGYAVINNASNTLNLYDEDAKLFSYNFSLKHISGAFDVLQNNTALVAQNEMPTSWNILLIDLPKLSRYDMVMIINSKYCFGCDSSEVITLDVFSCTFNDPGGQYYIQMDNSFVMDGAYNEPIFGIDSNVWIFQTENITSSKRNANKQGDTRGTLRLTILGSQHFKELNGSGKHAFFDTLINNLTFMIPTEKGRLRSDENYQLDTSNILISLSISEANDTEKLTAADIKDNLHQLITNKAFTCISTKTVTDFLDENYGFQQAQGIGEKYRKLIIIVIMVYITLCLLSSILNFKLKSKNFEAISSETFKLGLVIPHFVFLILFVVYNSNDIQVLHLPSVLFLSIPMFINFCIVIYAIYKGINDPIIGENFKEWIIKYKGLVAMFIILATTDYEYLTILKDGPIFTKILCQDERFNSLSIFNKFKHIFGNAIIWGTIIDIFF